MDKNELIRKRTRNNIPKFYIAAFFGNWSFATGILVFHYRELGFSFLQIFTISVVYEILNFFLEIPTGVLADLWSCKKTITLGYFISGFSFFIVLLNPDSYKIYIVWSILSAVCTTLNSGSVTAYIYDSVHEYNSDEYPKVLGRISAISLGTQAISIITGGILSDLIGFNLALFLSGIGGILQTIVIALTHEPIMEKTKNNLYMSKSLTKQFLEKISESFKILFTKTELKNMLYYGIFIFILSEFVSVIYQPYFSNLGFSSKTEISIFSAGSLIILAISSIIAGHWKNSNNKGNLLETLSFCLCLSLILIKIPALGIPSFIIFYGAMGIIGVVFSDRMNRLIPSNSRATILSAQNQLGSIL